ncbi:MAG: DUF2130 domain-containing protein [Phycisphaerales bacterium]
MSSPTPMPADPIVTCPSCQHRIPLTETLAAPFIESARASLEASTRERQAALTAEAEKLRDTRERMKAEGARVAAARERLEEEVRARLETERTAIRTKLEKSVREEQSVALRDLQTQLAEKAKRVAEAEAAELELRKHKHALEEERRSFELEKQRQLDAERTRIREVAQKESLDQFRLREAEKEKVIGDLRKQIDDLQRRADQGSQQLQGEVQELDLELTLRSAFPRDVVDEVPKGQHGGDAVHRVASPSGATAGTILWESKRTKAWSDGWLAKLRDDQRTAKADVSVILTAVLPKGIERFGQVDGVWVTDEASALPLASALRQMLIRVHAAQQAGVGRQSKMELLYEYMMGAEFRHRIEGIVESYTTMRDDLEAEKRALTKHWKKREKQLAMMMDNTTSMYGELQAIAGRSLPELAGLELHALEARADDD